MGGNTDTQTHVEAKVVLENTHAHTVHVHTLTSKEQSVKYLTKVIPLYIIAPQ